MIADIACGGTGGHMFPGLAVAEVLLERNHTVRLWLTGRDLEKDALVDWSGEIVTIPSAGIKSKRPGDLIHFALAMYRARKSSIKYLRNTRGDVMLGMGSYACAGPVMGALKCGQPVVMHEANVLPGKAVQQLSRYAQMTAISFDESRYYLKKRKLTVTGMPLRSELTRMKPSGNKSYQHPVILVMGGSKGANVINQVCARVFTGSDLPSVDLDIIHVTGRDDYEQIKTMYAHAGTRAEVIPFTPHMGELYKRADAAICRSGASTCAELSLFGLPALFVPYPYATGDHQMLNAQAISRKGAADVIRQENFDEKWLTMYLKETLLTASKLESMSSNMRKHAEVNSAERLADVLEAQAASSGR